MSVIAFIPSPYPFPKQISAHSACCKDGRGKSELLQ